MKKLSPKEHHLIIQRNEKENLEMVLFKFYKRKFRFTLTVLLINIIDSHIILKATISHSLVDDIYGILISWLTKLFV